MSRVKFSKRKILLVSLSIIGIIIFVWFYILSKDLTISIVFPLLSLIPISIVIGIIASFFSTEIGLKWKVLIATLTFIIILVGIGIKWHNKQPLDLPNYLFFDYGETKGSVGAYGTWKSNPNVYIPETTVVECSRNTGECIETIAKYYNGSLLVYNEYWIIESWTPDEIKCKDKYDRVVCGIDTLRIDRKGKAVIMVERIKTPRPKGCENERGETFVLHLTDGNRR